MITRPTASNKGSPPAKKWHLIMVKEGTKPWRRSKTKDGCEQMPQWKKWKAHESAMSRISSFRNVPVTYSVCSCWATTSKCCVFVSIAVGDSAH
jgi:hypothetical protein